MQSDLPLSHPSASSPPASLRRAFGPWDLTAVGINQVIGGAIVLIQASTAAEIGTWSPIAFVLAGFAVLLIALCYAETESRFSVTGLRKPRFPAAAFVLPFGATIPVAAAAISLTMFAGATREQLTTGGAALAAGALLYACNKPLRRAAASPSIEELP